MIKNVEEKLSIKTKLEGSRASKVYIGGGSKIEESKQIANNKVRFNDEQSDHDYQDSPIKKMQLKQSKFHYPAEFESEELNQEDNRRKSINFNMRKSLANL